MRWNGVKSANTGNPTLPRDDSNQAPSEPENQTQFRVTGRAFLKSRKGSDCDPGRRATRAFDAPLLKVPKYNKNDLPPEIRSISTLGAFKAAIIRREDPRPG